MSKNTDKFKVGDVVCWTPLEDWRNNHITGTIVELKKDRAKVCWDELKEMEDYDKTSTYYFLEDLRLYTPSTILQWIESRRALNSNTNAEIFDETTSI